MQQTTCNMGALVVWGNVEGSDATETCRGGLGAGFRVLDLGPYVGSNIALACDTAWLARANRAGQLVLPQHTARQRGGGGVSLVWSSGTLHPGFAWGGVGGEGCSCAVCASGCKFSAVWWKLECNVRIFHSLCHS